MRWLDGITDAMDVNLGKLQVRGREEWCVAVHGVRHDLATEPQEEKTHSLHMRERKTAYFLFLPLPHQPHSQEPNNQSPAGRWCCTEIIETVLQPMLMFIFLLLVRYQPFLH